MSCTTCHNYLGALTGPSGILRLITSTSHAAASSTIDTVLRLGCVQKDFKGGDSVQLSCFLVHFAWRMKEENSVIKVVGKKPKKI